MAKTASGGMRLLGIAGGLALLVVAWRFPVPMYPEPTTLLSLIAVLIGSLVGWREGLIITALYMIAVILGLPPMIWGAKPGVEAFLDIVNNGFVVGLMPAAVVAGLIAPQGKGTMLKVLAAMLAGHAAYLLVGVVWMMRFANWHTAIAEGFYPYLIPALAKSAAGFGVVVALRRFV